MKKFIITVVLLVITILCCVFTSCDSNTSGRYLQQYCAREVGGSVTINLEPGEKLIEATWKDDGNIWYLVEPMDSDYIPKTKIFKEKSLAGVWEGKVIFVETR